MKEFEPKVDPYAPTEYEEKYREVNKFTYEVMADLHYDVIKCANAARRAEWYYFL